ARPDRPTAVLQARRPRAVDLPDESRAPVRDPGGLAPRRVVAAARCGRGGPGAIPAVLRRWLAPVRVPLRARLDTLRHRAVRDRGRNARADRARLADPDPVRRRGDVRGGLLGIWHLTSRFTPPLSR